MSRTHFPMAGMLGSLLMILCCGCSSVESTHPLSDAKTIVQDDRLLGEWLAVDAKSAKAEASEPPREQRFVIRKAGDALSIEAAEGNEKKPLQLLPTKIGERRYLSMTSTDPAQPEIPYMLFQYEFAEPDRFKLYIISPDRAGTLVQQGKLKGTIKRQDPQPGDDPNVPRAIERVRLTSSTAELRAFIASPEGAKLFHAAEPVLILQRPAK